MLLIAINVYSQDFTLRANAGEDATKALQSAFADQATKTVTLNSGNIIVNGTLNIPQGKNLKIEDGCKLTGTGTINGIDLNENYQAQLFDTSLTVNPRSVNQYFSVKWFGAKRK